VSREVVWNTSREDPHLCATIASDRRYVHLPGIDDILQQSDTVAGMMLYD
jgi:hypothetical protein